MTKKNNAQLISELYNKATEVRGCWECPFKWEDPLRGWKCGHDWTTRDSIEIEIEMDRSEQDYPDWCPLLKMPQLIIHSKEREDG